ncbi:MAG: phosphopyruvate hydratase [Chlamydiales bacterium]|nr:phosphopyruvate hydratase [Chlamydiales bacterium]
MTKINFVHAREILDSRGNPTIEVTVQTKNGLRASAAVPSGASTGEHEAIELRDKDPKRYLGKGVLNAIKNVHGPLTDILMNEEVTEQEHLDTLMIKADNTENKSNFGANAILGCSLAIAKVAALTKNIPLYQSILDTHPTLLPCPMLNILNGGAHADNTIDFQEFMIRPIGARSFAQAMQMSCEIFHTLKKLLHDRGLSTSIGDEGGFAPNLNSAEEALDFIMLAIEKAGYKPKQQVTIALDAAASFMFDKQTGKYIDRKKQLKRLPFTSKTGDELIEYLASLTKKYPIDSIEDGLDENDWAHWSKLTSKLGSSIQLVGDDLFVTNPTFLKKGIETKAANAILIKLNQIGTLTETLRTIQMAHHAHFKTIVSHRSGETEDTFIADLAVATGCGQIKTGSVCRSERVAKYNRLLQIEEDLGKNAHYFH